MNEQVCCILILDYFGRLQRKHYDIYGTWSIKRVFVGYKVVVFYLRASPYNYWTKIIKKIKKKIKTSKKEIAKSPKNAV